MATAELAVAMPALLLVLALALSAVMTGVDQIRCVDAARAGVRLVARGEAGAGSGAARQAAPAGASVSVSAGSTSSSVTVVGRPRGLLRLAGVSFSPKATAVAVVEQSLADAGGGP
ncbi:TadE family type IV pilus minor pilin [Actinomycetota bacterium]